MIKGDIMPKKGLQPPKGNPVKKKKNERMGTKAGEQLQATLKALPDLMFEVDLHGRIYDFNAPNQDELYTAPERFLDKFVAEVLPKEPAAIIMKAIEEASRAGRYDGARYWLDFPDGRKWFELSIATKGNPGQADAHFMVLARNITESKRNLDALARSEEKYRTIIDSMQEGYFETDLAGRFTFVNNSLCEIIGYDSDVLIGMIYRKYVDKENEKKVYEVFNRVYRTRMSERSVDWEIIRKDGTHRFIETSVSLIVDTIDTPNGFRGIVHDITGRKKAEEINRILSNISEKILNAAISIKEVADMVMIHAMELTDSEQAFLSESDPATGGVHGKNDAGGINLKHVVSTVPDDIRQAVLHGDHGGIPGGMSGNPFNVRETFFVNDASKHERYRSLPDGHFPLWRFLVAPAVMQGELMGIIVVANSPREYTESDLETMKRLAGLYAIAINRIWNENQIRVSLKEKELLLKEIHHRVKNNMQIISSLLGLQSSHVKDKRDKGLFEVSQNRVRSMALVHEKLYQSESLSGIDFQEYITDLVDELFKSYYLEERVNITINAKNILVNIDDAIPCSLIIHELVSNALKHAFPDGRNGNITIDFYREGENSVLRIGDNGIGLPAGLDYQSTESLGLQLVNALTQQLRGTISVNAAEGTAFTIIFRGRS
jgi:PAS domain S-box-containing protein